MRTTSTRRPAGRRAHRERGIAMITTLLVMMLMSALLVGFTTVVMSDQRYRYIDRDRTHAFYAASAGIEKLTSDLGRLFLAHVAPKTTELSDLVDADSLPIIDEVSFTSPMAASTLPTSALTKCAAPNTIADVGNDGYTIHFCAAPDGNPTTSSTTPIKSGPYEGLVALQMPFQIDVTAKTRSGGDVHLVRTLEAVAIPVFQFGIFSDVDLSFFAGPNFNFGGRVHTNGNLFLSQGNGATLTLSDKVTAVREVIRQRMQNGVSIDTSPAHAGTVNMAQSPGVFRALLRTEGSLTDGVGSAQNEPLWHATSLSTYNSWIRNGRTGAKPLNLALITVGGSNPDLIRRPAVGEDASNPMLLDERLFTKASLRILLSDKAEDITSLPTVTADPPVSLEPAAWPPAGYTGGTPIAASRGINNGKTSANTSAGATDVNIENTAQAHWFKPVLTLGGVSFTCTGKTAGTPNTFTGCGNHPAAGVGAAVTSGDASTTLTAAALANSTTLTVGSTSTFMPQPFWLGGSLVTCRNYEATRYRNCAGVPATTSGAIISTGALSTAGTGAIGGYIKIERGNEDGSWTDVTASVLSYGIAGTNLSGESCGTNPYPDAILRLQRLRDNTLSGANGTGCNYASTTRAVDFWPNVLYDTREGTNRDADPGGLKLGGVMHYITIDVANLAKWFVGSGSYAASNGIGVKLDNGGYTVYFSDRRNNRNASNEETGDYGYEDIVNPASSTGTPNGTLDTGEDTNGNGVLDVYGGVPNYGGSYNTAAPGATAPLTTSARPQTTVARSDAMVNRAILFRRALKLTNGNDIIGNGITGLTIVSENPVYVQGNWNSANGGGSNFDGAHAATSVMADAVTLLTNGWSDVNSFVNPYAPGSRTRNAVTYYRLAIISGKGMAFNPPSGTASDFGTDGGAHNFLRYLENDAFAVNYRGSMATFFYNRQAMGTFKCCATVYTAPTRNYAFDTDFLNPRLLPPNTPMFRDLNTVGFAQEMRPGR